MQDIITLEVLSATSEKRFSLDELVFRTKELFETEGLAGFVGLILALSFSLRKASLWCVLMLPVPIRPRVIRLLGATAPSPASTDEGTMQGTLTAPAAPRAVFFMKLRRVILLQFFCILFSATGRCSSGITSEMSLDLFIGCPDLLVIGKPAAQKLL